VAANELAGIVSFQQLDKYIPRRIDIGYRAIVLEQKAAFTLWCSGIARDRASASDAERVRCATRCTDSEPPDGGTARSIGLLAIEVFASQ